MTQPIPEIISEINNNENENGLSSKDECFKQEKIPYLDAIKHIISYYFTKYEEVFNIPHPKLKKHQFIRIAGALAQFMNLWDCDMDSLAAIIDKHFETRYPGGCDYNINHFATGGILLNRMYEAAY